MKTRFKKIAIHRFDGLSLNSLFVKKDLPQAGSVLPERQMRVEPMDGCVRIYKQRIKRKAIKETAFLVIVSIP
ncbi:MAG TPA: hypothetical protein DCL41_03555 [Bdellovibrionales bacterium]|nr:hypothetical protein [Pseudobdellovibrionaceae bacterium]HAG90917.1 hypothetical protein [Bdellovibrionales bacterium]